MRNTGSTHQGVGISAIVDNTKKEISRIEQYRDKVVTSTARNIAFGGLILGGFFIIGMFALQIISGVLALGVTVIAVVAGVFGIRYLKAMDPVFKQKLKNHQVAQQMSEARRNAVAQLDNQVILNSQRLEIARNARNKMGASLESLRSQIDPANEGKPNFQRKVELLEKVENAYQRVCKNLETAAHANKNFEAKVVEYKQMERFAVEASKAMSFLKTTGDSEIQKMLSLEAFTEIETNFNTAIIEIENSVNDMDVDMA